jgi:hypothetical protein
MTKMTLLVLIALAAAACALADDAQIGTDRHEENINAGDAFRRVVMTRVYQHDRWMLPAADGYRTDLADVVDRRIAYVCDKLAELQPTYVSGLVRYDALEAVDAGSDQVRVYHGVRGCLEARMPGKKIRFDVVLNAIHYTKPQAMEGKPKYGTKRQAARALKDRLGEIDTILQPDIIFFDFYSVPFHHSNWFPDALLEGIRWIHEDAEHLRFVGGNVWGMQVPRGTDFVALDNFDRKHLIGFEFVKQQVQKLGGEYPMLLHLENNPTKKEGKGTRWTTLGRSYRRDVLAEHATSQNKVGYWYMYPVFFPTCIDLDGDRTCDCEPPAGGSDRRCTGRPNMSYDAFQDVDAGGGNPMSDKIAEYLSSETNR